MAPVLIFLSAIVFYALLDLHFQHDIARTAFTDETGGQRILHALEDAAIVLACVLVITSFFVFFEAYNKRNVLLHFLRAIIFLVLSVPFAIILHAFITTFELAFDVISYIFVLANFSLVSTFAILFFDPHDTLHRTSLLCFCFGLTWPLTGLGEYSIWATLIVLVIYDLLAVLTPWGPLRYIMKKEQELEKRRDQAEKEAEEAKAKAIRASASGRRSSSDGGPQETTVRKEMSCGKEGEEVNENGTREERKDSSATSVLSHSPAFTSITTCTSISTTSRTARTITTTIFPPPAAANNNNNADANADASQGESEKKEDDAVDLNLAELPGLVYRGDYFMLGCGDFVFFGALMFLAARSGSLVTIIVTGLGILVGITFTIVVAATVFSSGDKNQALPALPVSIALGLLGYALSPHLLESCLGVLSEHGMGITHDYCGLDCL